MLDHKEDSIRPVSLDKGKNQIKILRICSPTFTPLIASMYSASLILLTFLTYAIKICKINKEQQHNTISVPKEMHKYEAYSVPSSIPVEGQNLLHILASQWEGQHYESRPLFQAILREEHTG